MAISNEKWPSNLKIEKLGIIGVGLLGGSIGLAIKDLAPNIDVIGMGRREETLSKALKRKAIDSYTLDIVEGVKSCDLVVIGSPIDAVAPIFFSIVESLKHGAVVTDVGSTKEKIVQEIEREATGREHFVGSHPMAGSEQSGVDAADVNLYRDSTVVITKTESTNETAFQLIQSFWRALGGRIEMMTPSDHDKMVAHTSHLPHIVSSCLSYSLNEKYKPRDLSAKVYGNGLLDTTRVSEGDPAMWLDILTSNRENILDSIARFRSSLDLLEHSIHEGKREDIIGYLMKGKRFRESISRKIMLEREE